MKLQKAIAFVIYTALIIGFGIVVGRATERKAIRHGDITCPREVGWHLDMHSEADEVKEMFQVPKDSAPQIVQVYVEREDGRRRQIKEWSFNLYTEPPRRKVDPSTLENRRPYVPLKDVENPTGLNVFGVPCLGSGLHDLVLYPVQSRSPVEGTYGIPTDPNEKLVLVEHLGGERTPYQWLIHRPSARD